VYDKVLVSPATVTFTEILLLVHSPNVTEISFSSVYFSIGRITVANLNPEKPDVPLNKNDAFQKVQKRRVQEKR